MISVEAARERILAKLRPTPTETIALANAWGRVLAAPLTARLTQPPADVSAMDGFALRAADATQGATLRIIGAAPAGHPFTGSVGAGEAVRLFTGSFMPAGADTVLLQEDASWDGETLTVNETCAPHRHIRPTGQDFRTGDILIPAGKPLSARDIGLAAAGNHPWLTVHRRPRIAILATGDEIALPGEALTPGGIYSSNAHALAAFVTACGGEAMVLPIAADERGAIAAGADAAQGCDLLLTTGGASVGDHDLVQAGLEARGLKLDFWKIAMRPGKPLMFGWVGGASPGAMPLLGLPGNPVSAFVCAVLFLRPAIAKMSGQPAAAPEFFTATLAVAIGPNAEREDYLRATLHRDQGTLYATPFAKQDSGMLRSLAQAGALIRRPAFDPPQPEGAMVHVILLTDL